MAEGMLVRVGTAMVLVLMVGCIAAECYCGVRLLRLGGVGLAAVTFLTAVICVSFPVMVIAQEREEGRRARKKRGC